MSSQLWAKNNYKGRYTRTAKSRAEAAALTLAMFGMIGSINLGTRIR